MNVEGIPESITREQYLGLLRAVGLDPNLLVSCVLGARSIEAVIYARNAEGRRYLEGKEPAKHHISIPITG